eukprot:1193170-Prorocentrum_minimum.AAC.1
MHIVVFTILGCYLHTVVPFLLFSEFVPWVLVACKSRIPARKIQKYQDAGLSTNYSYVHGYTRVTRVYARIQNVSSMHFQHSKRRILDVDVATYVKVRATAETRAHHDRRVGVLDICTATRTATHEELRRALRTRRFSSYASDRAVMRRTGSRGADPLAQVIHTRHS